MDEQPDRTTANDVPGDASPDVPGVVPAKAFPDVSPGVPPDVPLGVAFDSTVDARGLKCPLPILKAKKALATIQSGQILKVMSTDPGSKRDFEAFARQTGNALVGQSADDLVWTFYLKRR